MTALADIPTPRVFVDLARVRQNISKMAALASGAGVRLRPHAKTHKSPRIAQWQLDAGAVGICCAKLGEAEVFADAGVADIRLPYPVHPSNAERVIALLDRTHLSFIVDDLGVARQWSGAMRAANRLIDVLVKVDVGFHRCGIDPASGNAVGMIRDVTRLPGLRFAGLLSHAGHGYGAASEQELEQIARTEGEILGTLAARVRASGADVREISVGATPTARFIRQQPGVTEMRPGNYVFFDRTQVGLAAAAVHECALFIVATVVSRPAADRVILDAGSKTLSSDGARGFGASPGFGAVFPSLTATDADPSIVIERLSEEHATVRVPDACSLEIGDRVRILPNHSCVVANLSDELLAVEGQCVVDRLPVAARGRIF